MREKQLSTPVVVGVIVVVALIVSVIAWKTFASPSGVSADVNEAAAQYKAARGKTGNQEGVGLMGRKSGAAPAASDSGASGR